MRPLITVLLSALAACVPVPTPTVASLEAPPAAELEPLASGEALAVLPADEEESLYVAECVREDLAAALPGHRVLAMDEARDVLFPWLEPGQVPRDDAAVRTLLARPAVAAKLRDLRLRSLIEIDLVDETTVWGEGAELLLGGMNYSKVTDRVAARVVDLGAGCCRAGGRARATGIQGYAHATIWGVIILSAPQTAACHRLSAALARALRAPVSASR